MATCTTETNQLLFELVGPAMEEFLLQQNMTCRSEGITQRGSLTKTPLHGVEQEWVDIFYQDYVAKLSFASLI